MKKILSFFLAAALLSCGFCLRAGALDEETMPEYMKVFYIRNAYLLPFGGLGSANPYSVGSECDDVYDGLKAVLADSNVTADQCRAASIRALTFLNENQYIDYEYAKETYRNALKENNNSGWYTDTEWSEFEQKLATVKTALDGYDNTEPSKKALTDAFHAMLKAYNLMTNRGAKAGDINGDGNVNVKDVTLLQRGLAEDCELNGAQKLRAAVSGNRQSEALSINDATQIQRFLAEISDAPAVNNCPVLLSEMQTNPLANEVFLAEHVFNFNICPRMYEYNRIQNGFYSTKYFINSLSSWCVLDVFE